MITCLVLLGTLHSGFAKSPSEIAKEYLELVQKREYTKTARIYDPSALKSFRKTMDFAQELPEDVQDQVYKSLFGGTATPELIQSMTDEEFFGTLFLYVMKQAEVAGNFRMTEAKIIGEVEESDSLAHVVARTTVNIGEMDVESMEIMSFTKASGEWKALVSSEINGIPEQLKKSFTR